MVFLDSIPCVEAGHVPGDLVPTAEVGPSSLKSYSKLLSGNNMSLCRVLAPLRTRLCNIAHASMGSEGRPNLTNRQCYCIALEHVQDLCLDEWREQAEKLKHVH